MLCIQSLKLPILSSANTAAKQTGGPTDSVLILEGDIYLVVWRLQRLGVP